MTRSHRSIRRKKIQALATAVLAGAPCLPGWAADTDIYGPSGAGGLPNVVFLLDNTSNWSAAKQAWSKTSVDSKCNAQADASRKAVCLNYSSQIFGGNADLTQGQVQLRALKLVLNELVCSGTANALKVNVGLSMIGDSGSTVSNGHASGFIRYAVQTLTGTAASGTCKTLIDELDNIDSKIQNPTFKAPSNANYGAAMYEIFKYFGGHSNPTLAGNVAPNGATPVSATGYGPVRYSKVNTLDDPAAFTDATRSTYKGPISAANSCGNNYIVLVGNTYPNFEPNNGGPTIFSGIGYTPPALSPISSDTSRYADEWAYFLANTDVSSEAGIQRIFTYAINTYNDKPDADQGKLLKSMAAVGGIGPSGYIEVGGDLLALVDGFREILVNIAAVNSVFTATTLPVSTTTQGTYLNQIFLGMFRPDGDGSPRWVGNLKQYQLGLISGTLGLVDKNNQAAVLGSTGFLRPLAASFWTEDSVFFTVPSGTPASASDLPDGPIVEKGGAAQMLRKTYLQGASSRNVKTISGGALATFTAANTGLTTDEVNWIRGENNVATGEGVELFGGSYKDGADTKLLGPTGARHSIHGDVLHSRPVALNYGNDGVVVYYGANDGFFRAVDGNKTGGTAGQELWSFVAPEHFDTLKRLRAGTPKLHLPETNSSGATIAPLTGFGPKSYAMDGPIGVYAKYASNGSSVTEAIIYPTMRRGGRNVYAFNVSTKGVDPTFAWPTPIIGGSGDYTKLAQTWSMPKPVLFKVASGTAPVILLMGGGYDPAEDTNGSSGIGNVVYVIDGRTGARIAELPTAYSVPSDVTVLDVDMDGQADRAYVSDVRGNLYRIDFPAAGEDVLDGSKWNKITKIAELGGKVFFAPDAVVTKSYVAVLVGTGDREKPLMVSTADNFFMIKDNLAAPRATALVKADLTRVATIDNTTMQPTNLAAQPITDPEGCYLELATNGEKVVNAPFSIAGATYFGTNRPTPANANSCNADLGQAHAYKFPLFCSVPPKPSIITGGGLPPSPVGGIVTLLVDGKEVKYPFLIGGTGPSNFDVVEPKPPIPPVRTRQTWRIDNSNK